MRAVLGTSPVMYRDDSSVLPHCREVMGEENGVAYQDHKENRSLWEMLQGPVRDTIRARRIAELETPDGFLNLFRGGQLGFPDRCQEVRPQRHVDHLNNCRDRRIGQWLKLSLQIVSKGFGVLRD
jgi:hypothetical protein